MPLFPHYFENEYENKTEKWRKVADYIATHPNQHLTADDIANACGVTSRHVRNVMDDLDEAGLAETQKNKKVTTWMDAKSFGHQADTDVTQGVRQIFADVSDGLKKYTKTLSRTLLLISVSSLMLATLNVLLLGAVSVGGPTSFLSFDNLLNWVIVTSVICICTFILYAAVVIVEPWLSSRRRPLQLVKED